jgi:hypothetical protein
MPDNEKLESQQDFENKFQKLAKELKNPIESRDLTCDEKAIEEQLKKVAEEIEQQERKEREFDGLRGMPANLSNIEYLNKRIQKLEERVEILTEALFPSK